MVFLFVVQIIFKHSEIVALKNIVYIKRNLKQGLNQKFNCKAALVNEIKTI